MTAECEVLPYTLALKEEVSNIEEVVLREEPNAPLSAYIVVRSVMRVVGVKVPSQLKTQPNLALVFVQIAPQNDSRSFIPTVDLIKYPPKYDRQQFHVGIQNILGQSSPQSKSVQRKALLLV